MTCIRPAGRRGACSCGNQYAQILDRLDTVEQEASDAKTTAQTAANTASIQAANAAADAAQAASDAGDALTQATAAAASAAAAALDAGSAAADLASINSTISTTLTTYLGTKVDKLATTGSFAYTHINATQGETALVDGTTGNTIPIRDASGYLKAASPATGVHDTNLANGTKVKNELDNYAPMVRTTGNQTIGGGKTFSLPVTAICPGVSVVRFSSAHNGWCKVAKLEANNRLYRFSLVSCTNNTKITTADFIVYRPNNTINAKYISKYTTETLDMCVTKDSNNEFVLWVSGPTTGFMLIQTGNFNYAYVTASLEVTAITDSGNYDLDHKPTTSDGYAAVYDVEAIS